MAAILMMGTFDSKGKEFEYLYNELSRRNVSILTMNTGVFEPDCDFTVQINACDVAESGGSSLEALREKADRGQAMAVMCKGAAKICRGLYERKAIDGIISMGGGGGTSIAASAMQALPIGFPKIIITTLASGDTTEYVGTKDIVLYPAIVDISGINNFSRQIISRAAGAICGMAQMEPEKSAEEKPTVFLTMFGNSTQCVEQCAALLEKDYTSMVFHATGGGGRTLEELILGGYADGCLDITTTEWADELCHGILSAGPKRLDGPNIACIPHLIVPGCLDMVNFGSMPTVPEQYKKDGRLFYEWNPMVTLMRTNREENERLGRILADKANASTAPTAFLFPTKGLSILDGAGQPFCDWETNEILFRTIEENVRGDIEIYRIDANINDMEFSRKAVEIFLDLMAQKYGAKENNL